MPASTLDILHNNWESKEKILSDFKLSCSSIGGTFYTNNNEMQVHKKYNNRDAVLIFEIEGAKSLEWYYEQYPMAKLEPENRVPYFIFNKAISGADKLFTIVTANCYLDYELVYDFFKEYLRLNSEKFIYINKSTWFGLNDFKNMESQGGYQEGWLSKLTLGA